MDKSVYFDNAATTCLDRRVIDKMRDVEIHSFGNPSNLHSFGTAGRELLELCRSRMASFVNGRPDEIVFTSGGTESNNLALKGIALANRNIGNHIIISSIEHDSVWNSARWLEDQGFFISHLPVDESGIVEPETLEKMINPKTILVSVMHANNEIGTIQPIKEIGEICNRRKVPFHTDACQSFGKIPVDVTAQCITLMSLNAHKIYGPKGVGALFIKSGTRLVPLLHGGGQESGRRSTTENITGIAGFTEAAALCMTEMESETKRLGLLRDKLVAILQQHFKGFYVNGSMKQRLANNLNFSIQGLEGETIRLLLLLDKRNIAVSAGSACSSNDSAKSVSRVLQAIGRNPIESRGAVRISLGRFNTELEVESFVRIFSEEINYVTSIFSM